MKLQYYFCVCVKYLFKFSPTSIRRFLHNKCYNVLVGVQYIDGLVQVVVGQAVVVD